MTYLARCHTLLQQGTRVVDVACLLNEGAPFDLKRYKLPSKLPEGYDVDFCPPEIIQRMTLKDGGIKLPSGVRYRFLEVVPERLTLPTARKIEELRRAGARVYTRQPIRGTPGLSGFPNADAEVERLTDNWPRLPGGGWEAVFAKARCRPDFEGDGLRWVHRRTDKAEIYFVANTKYEPLSRSCIFRVAGKQPELWDPETGRRYPIAHQTRDDGRSRIQLEFGPAQSWFVVFRDEATAPQGEPFPEFKPVKNLDIPWSVRFDPEWGSDKEHAFDKLSDWSRNADPLIRYYSGTGSYRGTFQLEVVPDEPLFLDLGRVEVVARVHLNGKDLGISWRPPHRFPTGDALESGENTLRIEVANTWVNRLVGDEQLPLDAKWKNWETLVEWPDWFPDVSERPSDRHTFTTARHYGKSSKLQPSGLIGPVKFVAVRKPHQQGDNSTGQDHHMQNRAEQ